MKPWKKKVAAACMVMVILIGNSMTAFAVPRLMSDGTVFDAEYYAQQNSDVVAVYGTDAAALYSHYQSYGKAEGRAPAAEGAVPVEMPASKTQTGQPQKEKTQTAQAETILSDEADEELAQYFADSVFIGDSIMVGFRNYCAKKTNYLHDIQFLAVGSYSANNALKPVKDKNVHPKYMGKKYQVWDAVPLMGSKRVFILLGMNDIAALGLEGGRDAYKEVLDKIEESSPGIEINIISVTYTLEGKGKSKLNNNNIAKYNVLLEEMARENGWGYIDLCTPLSDGKGNLAGVYCSDGFVHLSKSAYSQWEQELVKYAKLHLTQEKGSKTSAGTETAAKAKTKS